MDLPKTSVILSRAKDLITEERFAVTYSENVIRSFALLRMTGVLKPIKKAVR